MWCLSVQKLQKQDKQCKERLIINCNVLHQEGFRYLIYLVYHHSILIMSATHIAPALCRGCAWFARPPDSVKQVFVFFIVTV
jgi:hypothetical protein